MLIAILEEMLQLLKTQLSLCVCFHRKWEFDEKKMIHNHKHNLEAASYLII